MGPETMYVVTATFYDDKEVHAVCYTRDAAMAYLREREQNETRGYFWDYVEVEVK